MTAIRKKIYFLSDLHLGARYKDVRTHEAEVVAFLQSIEDDAKEVYLLGDILDYWFEYRTVVPRGYVRFFGQLARMADRGIRLLWFTGNHDIWLFDYLRDEIGIEVVDPPQGGVFRRIEGKVFYLGHGDTFGPMHTDYRILRYLFHNKVCQKLFSAVHPRWTIPLAHGWSSHNRTSRANPEIGMAWQERVRTELLSASEKLEREYPQIDFIIIGHYHIELDAPLPGGARLIVLGEWLQLNTYAVFDGEHLTLRRFGSPEPAGNKPS